MTTPAPLTTCLVDADRNHAHAVVRCAHCEEAITNPARLFEDLCDGCGYAYACANPDALGPDA